jgi:hypothetical protein
MEQGIKICTSIGYCSFIVPDTWTQAVFSYPLRELALSCRIHRLISLPSSVFPDAVVDTMIFVMSPKAWISNEADADKIQVIICHVLESIAAVPDYLLNQAVFSSDDQKRINFTTSPQIRSIINKVGQQANLVKDLFETTRGINAYDRYSGQSQEVIKTRAYHASYQATADFSPELMGEDVGRYEINWRGDHWIRYGDWLAAPREPRFFRQDKLLVRKLLSSSRIVAVVDQGQFLVDQQLYIGIPIQSSRSLPSLWFCLALLNSMLTTFIYLNRYRESGVQFAQLTVDAFNHLPILTINFATNTELRQQRGEKARHLYKESLNADSALIAYIQQQLDEDSADVVHDLLAFLAEQMIELNKQKQAEISRFLNWLEDTLRIKPGGGKQGLDVLTGKSILQNYLGDYQKNQPELPWESARESFLYRLRQNRNRYHIPLDDVVGQIEHEYERSLALLRPIKTQLAHTDALIDKIVYKLYDLTDEEIELIERPGYEGAIQKAKEEVVTSKIADDDEAVEQVAQRLLMQARSYFQRVEAYPVKARLDAALPGWHLYPDDVAVFLLTGEDLLERMPDYIDFSTAVVAFAKAVEAMIYNQVLKAFRADGRFGPQDCVNEVFQKFMNHKVELTWGNMIFFMPSSKEKALRQFIGEIFPTAAAVWFGPGGVIDAMKDETALKRRNKAAHDQILTRAEAEAHREWAFNILRHL